MLCDIYIHHRVLQNVSKNILFLIIIGFNVFIHQKCSLGEQNRLLSKIFKKLIFECYYLYSGSHGKIANIGLDNFFYYDLLAWKSHGN